jgi:Ca2+-binding RTX toxin-like protein
MPTITGTQGDDTITYEGPGTDVTILALDGNDNISIAAPPESNLRLDAGAGADYIVLKAVGGAGLTENGLTMTLGAGQDTIRGDSYTGAIVLDFQVGDFGDRLEINQSTPARIIQSGADVIVYPDRNLSGFRYVLKNVNLGDLTAYNIGYVGSEPPPPRTVYLTNGDDNYVSGDGDDFIYGLDGNDFIYGREGNDLLDGGAGNDFLDGGGGNDILYGRSGANTLRGSAGDDIYIVDSSVDRVVEDATHGYDIVYASVDYTIPLDQYVEVLAAAHQGGTAPLALTGNRLTELIYGNAGANTLIGASGSRTILVGFSGDDVYFVNGSEQVYENAGEGRDIVYSSVDYTLRAGSHVEILSTVALSSAVPINLTGNELTQLVYGNAGANTLGSGGGQDILVGFGGDDIYFVTGSGEQVYENAGEGRDIVYAGGNFTLSSGASVEILSTSYQAGYNAINLTGNELDNLVYGNNGNNVLDGGGGNDILFGYGGYDTFAFTSALGSGNVDTIHGFEVANDTILLAGGPGNPFAAIGPRWTASAFTVGNGPTTAEHRIIYHQPTGALYYDPDGWGAAPSVLFALVAPGTSLAATNFVVESPPGIWAAAANSAKPDTLGGPNDGDFRQVNAGAFADDSTAAIHLQSNPIHQLLELAAPQILI